MQKDREKRGGTAPGGGRRARHFAYLLLFLLTTISYIDRTTLSVAAPSIAEEFGLSPVETGYLLSSFLWTYVLALVPVGIWVDRSGARLVAASGVSPELVVLAIGCGSVFFSHVNDPGFWLVRGYIGTSTADTFRTWSVLETVISIAGLVFVMLGSYLL